MTDQQLLALIDQLKVTMISVSTGGGRIENVNRGFKTTFASVDDELRARGMENPLPYDDLWQWYGRWKQDDLPSYQSRRDFVAEMFEPLIKRIRAGRTDAPAPTGWARVDRTIDLSRARLAEAKTEEQFQGVGHLCREALISLGQEVFDPVKHPTEPGITVSPTDFKRMIEAFIAVELAGSSSDEARRLARAALDFALRLQHQRTATYRDAALCLTATSAVVNIIAIVSGRRDPAEPAPKPSFQLPPADDDIPF